MLNGPFAEDLFQSPDGLLCTESINCDPWQVEGAEGGAESDTPSTFGQTSSPEFANLSIGECQKLLEACVSPAATDESSSQWEFETDHTYLNKLEKRLERLYKVKGKAERQSMIKQLSDRADAMFNSDCERVDSAVVESTLSSNAVVKHLFPHQQALTADEKYELVKYDELSTDREEIEDSHCKNGEVRVNDSTNDSKNVSTLPS